MSIQTDRVFIKALQESEEIAELVGDRIYPISIPGTDEEAENEPVPYIVVMYDGFQNLYETKDNPYYGDEDRVTISILVTAESPDELAQLTELVRETIDEWMMTYQAPEEGEDLTPLIPSAYDVTGSEKTYDWLKPCYQMTLRYNCDTEK
jgi:hypothetical protein